MSPFIITGSSSSLNDGNLRFLSTDNRYLFMTMTCVPTYYISDRRGGVLLVAEALLFKKKDEFDSSCTDTR